MCGITGICDFDRAPDPALVERMNAMLIHRGPDDGGLHADGPACIAMRRLSIIDLSGSRQPMSNSSGTAWIVFNGEIYNFQESRAALEARGHVFRTHGDTEVILHLYDEYGLDFVQHLNGMFAIAIWDATRQRLVLARDRLGVKPLYYALTSGRLRFGSETKALLADPDLPRTIDAHAVAGFLHFNSMPTPATMFREIRTLPPAHLAVFDRAGLRIESYWDLDYGRKIDWKPDELLARVDELLTDSVRIRMISDVPLGAFLSGGVDSSLTFALMARQSSGPVEAFSIGFGAEAGYMNEIEFSKAVAAQYGARHHVVTLKPDDLLKDIERVAWFLDEPCGDAAAFLTLALSEFTRQYVTVALSGVGGDELFGGYRRYLAAKWHAHFLRVPRLVRRGLLLPALAWLPESRDSRWTNLARITKKFVRDVDGDLRTAWSRTVSYLPDYDGPIFSGDLRATTRANFRSEDFERLWQLASRSADPMDVATYMDIKTYLPDQLLFLQDKMTMAASLEGREPLLDYRLAELSATIPSAMKVPGRELKAILKRLAERYIPRHCIYREKKGFVAPLSRWFRGPLREPLEDALSPERVRQRGIFEPNYVQWLKRGFFEHNRDLSVQLFQALMLELWFRNVADGGGSRFAGTLSPVVRPLGAAPASR